MRPMGDSDVNYPGNVFECDAIQEAESAKNYIGDESNSCDWPQGVGDGRRQRWEGGKRCGQREVGQSENICNAQTQKCPGRHSTRRD